MKKTNGIAVVGEASTAPPELRQTYEIGVKKGVKKM
jgi:hypothetical protein